MESKEVISQKQRERLYRFLVKRKVPDVIAELAARNLTTKFDRLAGPACSVIGGAFIWQDTLEGHDFWSTAYEEAHDTLE